MKKSILIFFSCCLLTANLLKAQAPRWIWAEASNSLGSFDAGTGISADLNGNLFLGGRTAGMTLGGATSSLSSHGSTSTLYSPFSGRLDTSGTGNWFKEYVYSSNDHPYGFFRDKKNNTYSDGLVNSQDGMFINKYNSTGALQWSDSIAGADIIGYAIAADNQGNVYITGNFGYGSVTLGSTTLSYTGDITAIFFAKLDSNGKFIWAQSAGTNVNGYDAGQGIAIDNTGANIYFSGSYLGQANFGSLIAPSSGDVDLFITEYDSSGDALRIITAASGGAEEYINEEHILLDSCNNIYITGRFDYTAEFDSITVPDSLGDIFVAKCNSNGAWQWAKAIGTNVGSVALDKNTDVYICSNYTSPAKIDSTTLSPSGDTYVAKLSNSNGAVQWVQTAYTAGSGFGLADITVDKSKYVYVTGSMYETATFGSNSLSAGVDAVVVAKLDTVPMRTITPILPVVGYRFFCIGIPDSIYFDTFGTFNSGNTFTLQLSDSSGSFAHPLNVGSTAATTGGSIELLIPDTVPTGSDYLVRIVSTNPPVSSYASCDDYIALVICEGIAQVAKSNDALEIYPNPFSESATVKFTQPVTDNSQFTIFDLTGREVEQYIIPTGTQQLTIDRNNLVTGMYFYKVTGNSGGGVAGKIVVE